MKLLNLIGLGNLEKPKERTQFTLRINTELLNQVKKRAVKNKRSTVKEIEFMLKKAIENSK